MVLTLYRTPISPPTRAALLTIRSLGLEVELRNVDLFTGEHLTPEFLHINPRSLIPVMIDGDFVVTESRAIMAFLANSRENGVKLYPSDPKRRAVVDQRLYFDATVIFPRNCAAIVPVVFEKATEVPQTVKDKITEYMKILDSFLSTDLWLAGSSVTIADLSVLANISQIKACGYDLSQHENLSKWFGRCRELPGFEENQDGADEMGKLFKSQVLNGF